MSPSRCVTHHINQAVRLGYAGNKQPAIFVTPLHEGHVTWKMAQSSSGACSPEVRGKRRLGSLPLSAQGAHCLQLVTMTRTGDASGGSCRAAAKLGHGSSSQPSMLALLSACWTAAASHQRHQLIDEVLMTTCGQSCMVFAQPGPTTSTIVKQAIY